MAKHTGKGAHATNAVYLEALKVSTQAAVQALQCDSSHFVAKAQVLSFPALSAQLTQMHLALDASNTLSVGASMGDMMKAHLGCMQSMLSIIHAQASSYYSQAGDRTSAVGVGPPVQTNWSQSP